MVNTAGNNGANNGERPPDDVLKESLLRYASLRLSVAQKIANLAEEHGYHIKSTKLKELNKQFNIPTVRKPAPMSIITTLVCDKLDADVNQANGPDALKTFLALDGYQIPRDTIRQVMKDNAPGASKARYPGNKEKIVRKNLTALGVFQEVHCDGHEKLSTAALRMGPVGLSDYGYRDKATGLVAYLVVVPDARHSAVIGHVFLDFVQEHGAFPLQITVDKGSETGEMYAAQTALRKIFTPDLDPLQWPSFVAIKSVNNIPIENLWKWLLKTIGRSLREIIEDGKTNGLFNPANQIHIHLFHWLWSKIVQLKLDEFKLYWNYHTPRKNPKKAMISGIPPIELYRNPETYGLKRLSTPVDQATIDALRDNLEYDREEAFRWVPDDFDIAATQAYETINRPKLDPRRGWAIFANMAELLQDADSMESEHEVSM
ncbi:hypothetical protein B0H15DRAFT_876835 [Mycena belliarum]|uniref:Integrase core domain-containing protein n=1 Tax=Mycena belliarum TaxID=1033014 RepID=A0AAD6UFH9_9AGAR|nr:hypothetical protein B0H15DRAFT_876835 [Mycena belliae]